MESYDKKNIFLKKSKIVNFITENCNKETQQKKNNLKQFYGKLR